MEFRHEWKHEISFQDMLILRQRLQTVLTPDPNAPGGQYLVRSLYFDTPGDKALREKLDGVDRREKFRIRCYNADPSLIRLEKKSKLGGLGSKESAPLTPGETQSILDGHTEWMLDSPHPLIRELYTKMTLEGLRPKTIVDYTREPFVYAPGNVRVTLDYDIRSGLLCTGFLDFTCPTVPVKPSPIILEVKWDAFLPDCVRHAVQLEGRHCAPYSKYAACRIYG